ncbi:Uncharacterized protein OBRU01_17920, partial [Operophtera brumata]
MYNQNQSDGRRHSFNNNKVLVGGNNGKTHDKSNSNLIQINSDKKETLSAPILSQMVNPFDAMPPNRRMTSFQEVIDLDEEASNDAYDEDLRSRGFDHESQQLEEFDDFTSDYRPRPLVNQRFPRNWSPRNNFRPPVPNFGGHGQFRPRNGPRPNRWTGPRPQRF